MTTPWKHHARRLARRACGEDLQEIVEAILHLGEGLPADKEGDRPRHLDDFHKGDCVCVEGESLCIVHRVTRRGMWLADHNVGKCWVSRKHIGDVELVRPSPARR